MNDRMLQLSCLGIFLLLYPGLMHRSYSLAVTLWIATMCRVVHESRHFFEVVELQIKFGKGNGKGPCILGWISSS